MADNRNGKIVSFMEKVKKFELKSIIQELRQPRICHRNRWRFYVNVCQVCTTFKLQKKTGTVHFFDFLAAMKRLMADRQQSSSNPSEPNLDWIKNTAPTTHSGIIDGNFLSLAFGGALLVIVTVSIYAFYNLYQAVLKKFPSTHTEL
jgi:hypothetical protein